MTIGQWMYIGAYQLKLIDAMIQSDQYCIRANAITGIILSTLTGTLSVTTLGINDPTHIYTTISSVIFALFSFSVAIFTGYVKVYQIQERLESCIKLKQDWIIFTTTITSEMQLPLDLRRDALYLIIRNKDTYLDLIKRQIDVPKRIIDSIDEDMKTSMKTAKNGYDMNVRSLANVVLNIQDEVRHDVQERSIKNLKLTESSIQLDIKKDISENSIQHIESTKIDFIYEAQLGDKIRLIEEQVKTKVTQNIMKLLESSKYTGIIVDKSYGEYSIIFDEFELIPTIVLDSSLFWVDPELYSPPKFKVGNIVNAYHFCNLKDLKPIKKFYRATITNIHYNTNCGKPCGFYYEVRFHFSIRHVFHLTENRIRSLKPEYSISNVCVDSKDEVYLMLSAKYEDNVWKYTMYNQTAKEIQLTQVKRRLENNEVFNFQIGDYILFISNSTSAKLEKGDGLRKGVIIDIELYEDDSDKNKEGPPIYDYIFLESSNSVLHEQQWGNTIIPDRSTNYSPLYKIGQDIEYRVYKNENYDDGIKWYPGKVKDIKINSKAPGIAYIIQKEDNTTETMANIVVRAKVLSS